MKRANEHAFDVLQTHLADAENKLTIPVDPFALAAKLGISVSVGELKTSTAGVIVMEEGDDNPRIILNKSDPPNRQRFTLAHELGHYFRHHENGDHEFGYVDERADLASQGVDSEEIWSNAFAAELLMPGFAVRHFFSEGMTPAKLAKEFNVSRQAMDIRLERLGLA
jgi:hypothetical protein